jgi:hypothetical protein
MENPLVSLNEAEYKRMLAAANGNAAVAERRLLDIVDEANGEKEERLESSIGNGETYPSRWDNEKIVNHVEENAHSSLNESGGSDKE